MYATFYERHKVSRKSVSHSCLMYLMHGVISLLFNFINLTKVHNFTVSAQDIFTFRRLSVFAVSFTGISQVLLR